jgi:hypothetical protein
MFFAQPFFILISLLVSISIITRLPVVGLAQFLGIVLLTLVWFLALDVAMFVLTTMTGALSGRRNCALPGIRTDGTAEKIQSVRRESYGGFGEAAREWRPRCRVKLCRCRWWFWLG